MRFELFEDFDLDDKLCYFAVVDQYPNSIVYDEMREWCDATFIKHQWYVGTWTWTFEKEQDRTWFILRWG